MASVKETILAVLGAHEPQSFEALLTAVHKMAQAASTSDIRGAIWSLLAGGELTRTDEGLLVRLV